MPQLKLTDINDALLRQAVDDLEIAVPIRAWDVVNGKLLLHLAYSPAPAVWEPPRPDESTQTTDDGERESSSVVPRAPSPSPSSIPEGDLSRLLKRDLQQLARARKMPEWKRLRKAELVERLEALRGK